MKRNTLLSRLENEVEILSRHMQTLKAIKNYEPIGIIRLANVLGCPHHRIRYTLRVLEEEGLIIPTPNGAVTTKKVATFKNTLTRTINTMIEILKTIEKEL